MTKFWAISKINWSIKLDTSSSYEVRAVNGVVDVLHSSSDWISLKTHRMTPPTILQCNQSFGLDVKSYWSMKLEISSSLEVRSVNGVVGGLHSSSYWISLKTHRMIPPTILWCCPSFVLVPNKLVNEIVLHVRTKVVA